MDNTRSFDLTGIKCVFAQGPERPCLGGAKASLIAGAHRLSDALQAEHAEITHFQQAAKKLDDQMHELQRACEAYLTTCHAIDTGGLSLEMERLSSIGSCPYAKRD